MLESELLKSTSSWPFVEIRKLLKDRDSIIKKNKDLNSDLEKRHLEVQDKINSLEKKTKEVEKVRKNQIKQLELISGLSEKEAKDYINEL